MRKLTIEDFWARLIKTDTCWLWTGSYANGLQVGYGQFGRGVRAHRYSWELHKGPIPKGLHVLHECDNPPCVNPAHLKLGTQQQNVEDMHTRGRGITGRHEWSKLTQADVDRIRHLYFNEWVTCRKIAAEYDLSKSYVGLIVNYRKWA